MNTILTVFLQISGGLRTYGNLFRAGICREGCGSIGTHHRLESSAGEGLGRRNVGHFLHGGLHVGIETRGSEDEQNQQ